MPEIDKLKGSQWGRSANSFDRAIQATLNNKQEMGWEWATQKLKSNSRTLHSSAIRMLAQFTDKWQEALIQLEIIINAPPREDESLQLIDIQGKEIAIATIAQKIAFNSHPDAYKPATDILTMILKSPKKYGNVLIENVLGQIPMYYNFYMESAPLNQENYNYFRDNLLLAATSHAENPQFSHLFEQISMMKEGFEMVHGEQPKP